MSKYTMTTTQTRIGIDFSISSPAISIINDNTQTITSICLRPKPNSDVNKLVLDKQHINIMGNTYKHNIVLLDNITSYNSNEERYYNISNTLMTELIKHIDKDNELKINIENYGYATTGLVFNIAECTSVFKQMLWFNLGISPNYHLNLIAPSTVKKMFTGKGNANKMVMYETFCGLSTVDIYDCFYNIGKMNTKNIPSPISDIIDSIVIALC